MKMSKKRQDNQHEGFVPKYQQSGRQRKKPVRIIVISLIVVVVIAALGVIGWNYYNSQPKPVKQAVIKVGNVSFDLDYYVNTLKAFYGHVSPEALYDYTDYGEQDIEKFAGYVEHQIVRNEIIKQGSAALGVKIDRNDIKDLLKESDTPVTDERIDILMAQELIEKQVPSTQPQAHVQAILLESESVAQEAISRLQAGESFEQVSTALSKIPAFKIVNGDMNWVTAREADLTVASTKFGNMISGANAGILSDAEYDDTVTKTFGYWVVKGVEKQEFSDNTSAVRIKGILVGSEQAAYDVIDQLKAGADIDELAKQLSESPGAAENGAEVRWIIEGEDNGGFNAVFDLPLEEISAPIGDNLSVTKGGYWVYNILEKDDNRELTTQQKNTLVEDFYSRCSTELEKDPNYKTETLLTEEMRVSAINEVVLAQGEGSVLIRTSRLPYGEVGVSYTCQLEAYGNQTGNTWSITEGGLMEGLSLDGSTGIISGIPTVAGGGGVTIEVNSGLHYWSQEFVTRVFIPIEITTESLPEAQVGVEYSTVLEVMSEATTYTFSIVSGSLPDGISLSEASGIIRGTPTTAGTYEFTLQVDDSIGKSSKTLSLTVK